MWASDCGTHSVTTTRTEGREEAGCLSANQQSFPLVRFAYGRADVVLMCFDIGRMVSLEHCRYWGEIVLNWFENLDNICWGRCGSTRSGGSVRRLRSSWSDVRTTRGSSTKMSSISDIARRGVPWSGQTNHNTDNNRTKYHSNFYRQVQEKDIVMPEQGRAAAKEMGMSYFETSVLTFFGVNEVFENAIRAALCARRNQRFWMTNLRRVLKPSIQVGRTLLLHIKIMLKWVV